MYKFTFSVVTKKCFHNIAKSWISILIKILWLLNLFKNLYPSSKPLLSFEKIWLLGCKDKGLYDNKTEQIENIINDIKINFRKLRKFCNHLLRSLSKTKEALYRLIELYHLGPALLTNEINFRHAKKIFKSTESKIKIIPAWWNSELMLLINPRELTINWIRIII